MEPVSPTNDLAVAQQPGNLAYPQGVPMGMAAVDDLDGGDGFSVMGLLHSLRRQLLLALGLGLLFSTLLAILLYFVIPVSYRADALLKVNRDQKKGNASDFMIYKETQAHLIKSNFVVTAALRDNEINQLPMVKSDSRGFARKQPVAWLSGAISVQPGETEIIGVSMAGRDKAQTEQILDGVIESYLREIINKERLEKVDQLAKLRKRYNTLYQSVSKKTDEVMTYAKTLNAVNSEDVRRNLSMAINRLSGTQNSLDRIQNTAMELSARYQMVLRSNSATSCSPANTS
jgi:capsular polysaccharide biosynthesis protein